MDYAENNHVTSLLKGRSSVRDFLADDVPEHLLTRIHEAARQAPTSSNMQAYSLIIVRSREKRLSLAEIAGGQEHVAVAPVMIAVCADLHRLRGICGEQEVEFDSSLCELNLLAVIDASLVGMCASLAAESLGLGSVMIGGLRNDPVAVAELLGLPANVFCPFGLCIGWPALKPPAKPRLPSDSVVFYEKYDEVCDPRYIKEYDIELAQHYDQLGKENVIWSERIAKHCLNPPRADLSSELKQLGFSFR